MSGPAGGNPLPGISTGDNGGGAADAMSSGGGAADATSIGPGGASNGANAVSKRLGGTPGAAGAAGAGATPSANGANAVSKRLGGTPGAAGAAGAGATPSANGANAVSKRLGGTPGAVGSGPPGSAVLFVISSAAWACGPIACSTNVGVKPDAPGPPGAVRPASIASVMAGLNNCDGAAWGAVNGAPAKFSVSGVTVPAKPAPCVRLCVGTAAAGSGTGATDGGTMLGN
jgi:hypothetical protein